MKSPLTTTVPAGRGDGQGHSPRDPEWFTWINSTEKLPSTHYVLGLDHVELDAEDAVLFELEIHQRKGQFGAIQGHGHLAQHIGCCTDVILVAVHVSSRPRMRSLFLMR